MPEKFKLTAAWVALSVTVLFTCGGWVFVLSGDRSTVMSDIDHLEVRVTNLETLNRALHVQVTTMQADVSWIRMELERQRGD